MTLSPWEVQSVDRPNASETLIGALNRLNNRLRLERDPHDQPVPVEQTARVLRSRDPLGEVETWIVWNHDQTELLSRVDFAIPTTDQNRHIAQFDLAVAPESRGQGIGTALLERVIAEAATHNRSLLITASAGSVPAGEAFLTRIGADRGLEQHVFELELATVDSDLVRSWQERARERASDFELNLWDGPYPEESLEEVAEMLEAFNTVPMGDLDVEDFHFSADQVRAMGASFAERGYEHWTLIAREKSTGKIAGYTDVLWNPSRPAIVDQNLTAVFEPYRNRGLGRWLKAAMLDKILRDRPEAKFVRTGNADVNAPMLGINRELGFKMAFSTTVWQVPTERVQTYLAESARNQPASST